MRFISSASVICNCHWTAGISYFICVFQTVKHPEAALSPEVHSCALGAEEGPGHIVIKTP